MKQLALAAAAALVLAACSSSDAPAPAAGTRAPAAAPRPMAAYHGPSGYAFTTRDAPLSQVLAQSASSGRPALLFFWTDW